MRAPGTVQASIGTRVALRTFIIFGLTSALPVALFTLIGWIFVSDELEIGAKARLEEASKRYGLVMNERLIQAETLMIEAARVQLESGSGPGNSSLLNRMQILTPLMDEESPLVEKEVPPSDARLPAGWRATRALQADVSGTVGRVRLHVTVSDGAREVRLIVDPTDRAFWDVEQVLPNARVCVFLRGKPLHCDSGDASLRRESDFISAEWSLFLKPRYGSDEWVVRIEQPSALAYSSVKSFKVTLPIVAGIAIIGALLLAFTHLRRIHAPLARLVAAARRMSRGRFDEPLQVKGDDEFASVSRAFNRLADRLRRQLGLLATLSRIDRQILAHPTFEPVVLTLLPRIPRLVGCRAAAVLHGADGDADRRLMIHRARSGASVKTLPLARDAQATDVLRDACDERLDWLSLPITVEGAQRGVLLAGFPVDAPARAHVRRALRGVAHRLAVALGNEDRERALLRQAYFDTLTGLPNRQLFNDRLGQELLRSARESRSVSLLYVDLDNFRALNDSLGHQAGDALLRAVGERLDAARPEGFTLARLGGDEFAIICPGTNASAAEGVAMRLLQQLREPFFIDSRTFVIDASIGVAEFPHDAAQAAELLRCANVAMHRAKQTGRGRVSHFEEGIDAQAQRRLLVEQRLRVALDRGELTFVFQPKFHFDGRRDVAFEALARWHDSQLGVVSPGEFIPVAEDAGLIAQVGAMALTQSCRHLAAWRAAGLAVPHVAVNASVHQLRDREFPAFVARTLASSGLQPSSLQLEITESLLAHDDRHVIEQLSALRATGIRIAMDDFGTGYSSLATLRELPIDVLKIDRSFVIRCCDSAEDEALLRGVIELAHTLGKTVVAEGVETPGQLDLLRRLGCDVVQGFLLGRPMAPADVSAFLSRDGVGPLPVLSATALLRVLPAAS